VNKPSSTIQAAGIAGFAGASIMLIVKIFAPNAYLLIPPEYQGYLITALTVGIGYWKKENVLGK